MRGLKVDGSDCNPSDYPGAKNACAPACMGEACNWFQDGSLVGCDTCSLEGDWNDDCTTGCCYGHFKENGCTVNGMPTNDPPMPAETLPFKFRTYDLRNLSHSWNCTGKSATDHKPWTAPGHAPIANPCGVASGVKAGLPGGGDGHGKMPPVPVGSAKGSNGTDLKPLEGVVTKWEAGSVQEVAWAILANHGGGYQYRLCPKSAEPTEACFQSHPLPFVGNTTTIRMNSETDRVKVPDFEIPAMDVNVGTSPKGSFWRRDPVPACNCDLGFLCGRFSTPYWVDPEAKTKTPACSTGTQFVPPHPAIYGYGTKYNMPTADAEDELVQEVVDGTPDHVHELQGKGGMTYSLVDKVRVPEQTGEYILSWRWDCEQTAQVWNSCADIEIVAPKGLNVVV